MSIFFKIIFSAFSGVLKKYFTAKVPPFFETLQISVPETVGLAICNIYKKRVRIFCSDYCSQSCYIQQKIVSVQKREQMRWKLILQGVFITKDPPFFHIVDISSSSSNHSSQRRYIQQKIVSISYVVFNSESFQHLYCFEY